MKKIAVLRFSSLGDVAMTVPVIDSLARKYIDLNFVIVTPKRCEGIFYDLPDNVDVHAVHLRGKHSGFKGLRRLSSELRSKGVDTVADLHDVLRTKVLRKLLLLHGCKVKHIDKGRSEKRALVRHTASGFRQLKSNFERYAEVFRKLGLHFEIDFERLDLPAGTYAIRKPEGEKWIGIAPFAAHRGKIYSLRKMKEVIGALVYRYPDCKIMMFGTEKEMHSLRKHYDFDQLTYVCDQFSGVWNELRVIDQLDVMISMDSANMHLASLVQTPVVSIWGATHPYAGFYGYGQDPDNAIQHDLDCRPCSIFGDKKCEYGDYHCIREIPPTTIVKKMEEIIEKAE